MTSQFIVSIKPEQGGPKREPVARWSADQEEIGVSKAEFLTFGTVLELNSMIRKKLSVRNDRIRASRPSTDTR